MSSTKHAPTQQPDPSPEDRIRQIIAFSLCVESVADKDQLDTWPSLDVIEAVVEIERALGIPEIEEDVLLKCRSVGDLVRVATKL